MTEGRLRTWPEGVVKPGVTSTFLAAYRAAFDADPQATFCAGEIDGITLVVAVGKHAEKLQRFVENDLYGVIQRELVGQQPEVAG